jgi:hypothetical protein
MPATFEDAFARVKQLAADFKANEKFCLSPAYALTPGEIKIVEGATA